jgi:hypothetical protein
MSEQKMDLDIDTTPQPLLGPDAFTAALTLLAAASDPRATEKRLRRIGREQAGLAAARADLQQQSNSFREFEATTRAELEAGAKVNTDKAVALHVAETSLQNRERNLASRERELSQANESLKLRFMLFARIDEPGPLQDKPSWKMLAHELLQIEKDPHFAGSASSPDEEAQVERVRPDYVPANSTLTQTRILRRSRRAVAAMEH